MTEIMNQTHELSGFQRDLMVLVSEYDGEKPSGVDIRSMIGERYSSDVSHPRVYNNLGELVEMGLMEKGKIDDRTNYYRTTESGEEALEQYREFVGGHDD